MCGRIENLKSTWLLHRGRRLLISGLLSCAWLDADSATSSECRTPTPDPRQEAAGRNKRLSQAVNGWRARSGSVRSTTSTATSLKSFRTAPSTYEARTEPYCNGIDHSSGSSMVVQAFVFTDLIVLASTVEQHCGLRSQNTQWRLLDGCGIARIVSVESLGKNATESAQASLNASR